MRVARARVERTRARKLREWRASARVTRNARETRASRTRVAPWRLLPSFARRSSTLWENAPKRAHRRQWKKKVIFLQAWGLFFKRKLSGAKFDFAPESFRVGKMFFHKQRARFPSENSQGHTCRCKETRPPPVDKLLLSIRSVHTRSRTWVVAATTRRPNH